MGTIDIVPGVTVVVSYSNPSGVLSYKTPIRQKAYRNKARPALPRSRSQDTPPLLGETTHLWARRGGHGGRQRLAPDDEGDLVHQRLDLLCARGARTQLAQLGAQARVLRDVDVGREGHVIW